MWFKRLAVICTVSSPQGQKQLVDLFFLQREKESRVVSLLVHRLLSFFLPARFLSEGQLWLVIRAECWLRNSVHLSRSGAAGTNYAVSDKSLFFSSPKGFILCSFTSENASLLLIVTLSLAPHKGSELKSCPVKWFMSKFDVGKMLSVNEKMMYLKPLLAVS